MFGLGFFGSWAAEVIVIYGIYQREAPFPNRYKKFGYWSIRFLVAVIAGGLAVSYKLTEPLPAIHVGVATPLIIQAFSRPPRP
jgi:hypothetical protein